MCFSHRPVHSSPYVIKNNSLEHAFSFNNLEVTMDLQLDFSLHINTMILKAKFALSLVKRWSKETLVRPIVEYDSVI